MQRFIFRTDPEELFRGYWEEYTSHSAEIIFMDDDRELLPHHPRRVVYSPTVLLIRWNVERSYPSGKSDPFGRRLPSLSRYRASLEFVGKHHTKFAHLALDIRSICYVSTEFKEPKRSNGAFELQEIKKIKIRSQATSRG